MTKQSLSDVLGLTRFDIDPIFIRNGQRPVDMGDARKCRMQLNAGDLDDIEKLVDSGDPLWVSREWLELTSDAVVPPPPSAEEALVESTRPGLWSLSGPAQRDELALLVRDPGKFLWSREQHKILAAEQRKSEQLDGNEEHRVDLWVGLMREFHADPVDLIGVIRAGFPGRFADGRGCRIMRRVDAVHDDHGSCSRECAASRDSRP
jgi:hypothetical protein